MSDDKPQIDLGDFLQYCARKPKGYQTIYRFIHAIDNGYTPTAEDNQRLADALRELLCADTHIDGLHAFAQSLELKDKKGRKRPFGKPLREIETVVRVMLLEHEGKSKTAAQKEVSKKLTNQKDPLRNVKALYKQHEKAARAFLERYLDEQRKGNRLDWIDVLEDF